MENIENHFLLKLQAWILILSTYASSFLASISHDISRILRYALERKPAGTFRNFPLPFFPFPFQNVRLYFTEHMKRTLAFYLWQYPICTSRWLHGFYQTFGPTRSRITTWSRTISVILYIHFLFIILHPFPLCYNNFYIQTSSSLTMTF